MRRDTRPTGHRLIDAKTLGHPVRSGDVIAAGRGPHASDAELIAAAKAAAEARARRRPSGLWSPGGWSRRTGRGLAGSRAGLPSRTLAERPRRREVAMVTPKDAIGMLRDLRSTLQAEPGYAGSPEAAGLIGKVAGHAIEQMGALVEERDVLRRALELSCAGVDECPANDDTYTCHGCARCEGPWDQSRAESCWVRYHIERAKEAVKHAD